MHIVARYKSIYNYPDKENMIAHQFLKGIKNIALLYLIGKQGLIRKKFDKNATNYVSEFSDFGLPELNILNEIKKQKYVQCSFI